MPANASTLLEVLRFGGGHVAPPFVATDTIDYAATDNAGNTATSTRTVIVEAATSTTQ